MKAKFAVIPPAGFVVPPTFIMKPSGDTNSGHWSPACESMRLMSPKARVFVKPHPGGAPFVVPDVEKTVCAVNGCASIKGAIAGADFVKPSFAVDVEEPRMK